MGLDKKNSWGLGWERTKGSIPPPKIFLPRIMKDNPLLPSALKLFLKKQIRDDL